jgi:hypothetical protein
MSAARSTVVGKLLYWDVHLLKEWPPSLVSFRPIIVSSHATKKTYGAVVNQLIQ